MKLKAVQVQNYRSIVDCGKVEIDDRVTVVIGKNEQGKTNFLRALYSFNPETSYTPNDLPTHLRANLEEKDKSKVPIITLWLIPNDADRGTLKKSVPRIDEIAAFQITRSYDGYYYHRAITNEGTEVEVSFAEPNTTTIVESLKAEASALKNKLEAHGARLAGFASSKQQADNHVDQFIDSNFVDEKTTEDLVETFLTALKGLPGQDAAIQSDIALTAKNIEGFKGELLKILHSDLTLEFHKIFPHFIFHSSVLDKIPNEVAIAEFTKNPETTSKGMANLCKVAGLSIQKIQDLASTKEPHRRESYEDQYRASISGGINEFWTQEDYTIHFRIDQEKLSVSISDETYDRRIPPSDRSDGFQWYLSFYSALLSEVSATESTVVLLDNPGLELHADGQRDIKRFLQEKLPVATQVIYVTHSPAMIDTYNLEQVRAVELRGGMQGTKLFKLPLEKEEFDLLEPIRSAIGASLVDTLMTNDFNVLVEGAADKPILEGAFNLLLAGEAKKIVINGSISESGLLLPRFYDRTRLPFAIFLDADSGGRELKKKLMSAKIPEDKIVCLADIIKKKNDFELEDLFSSSVYHLAVKETYPDLDIEEIKDDDGKRTKRYEALFKEKYKIGFSKRRVGETVKRLLIDKKGDEETIKNLQTIVNKIWETLYKLVKPESADEKGYLGSCLDKENCE